MNTAGYLKFETKMDTNGFQKGINDIASKTKSGGGTIKNIVAGLGITKLIGMGINAITSSVGSAVKRIDTLRNYPKVMESLGYSAEQAEASIKRLDKGTRGLPTTMDEIAQNTQLLTASLGDLDKGTDTAIALNDMFLAGGQGSEAASRGLQQYNQMLAKGKVDQQSWNTIVEVASGQINQVAKSLLGADANQRDLYEALQNGTISMEDFNNEIIRLDKEGGEGFKGFHDQAMDATGGIETTFNNMKTAIVRGVGDIIEGIDNALKDVGGISGVISGVANVFETALKKIAPIIQDIIKKAIDIYKWMQKHKTLVEVLAVAIGAFIGTFMLIQKAIAIINAVKLAFVGLNLVMAMNPIVLIIAGVVALIAIFVVLWKKCDWFRNFWIGLWEGIKGTFLAVWNALKTAFTAVVDWVKNNWKSILLFLINPFAGAFSYLYNHSTKFRNFINGFVNAIVGFIKSIPGKIASIPGKIVNFFKSIPGKIKSALTGIKNIGKFLVEGLWKGINGAKDWILDKVSGLGKSIIKKIKGVLKIKSPSREMFAIGVNIDKGLIAGIDNTRKDVLKSASQLGQDVIDRMKGAVALETGNINASAMLKANSDYKNTLVLNASFDGQVDIDGKKAGRILAPEITKTIQTAGGR